MMSDKLAARKIAQNCGIPTIPGTISVVKGLAEVESFIKRLENLYLVRQTQLTPFPT